MSHSKLKKIFLTEGGFVRHNFFVPCHGANFCSMVIAPIFSVKEDGFIKEPEKDNDKGILWMPWR